MRKGAFIYATLQIPVIAIEEQFFKKVLVPNNQFCRVHVFDASSNIACATECLIREDFGSCTSFIFDLVQAVCQCGRSGCFEISLGLGDNSPTLVLVNMLCNRTLEGKHVNRFLKSLRSDFKRKLTS